MLQRYYLCISFNPRTRMGCDSLFFLNVIIQTCFNPRTRMGCDWRPAYARTIHISFNPRTRMGCDGNNFANNSSNLGFQSTHPHGVRPHRQRQCMRRNVSIHAPAWGATVYWICVKLLLRSFNPRTRMGCDTMCRQTLHKVVGFNPRTRMGCDLPGLGTKPLSKVSIHAPAWGATENRIKH